MIILKKLIESAKEKIGKYTYFIARLSLSFAVWAVIFAVCCYIAKDYCGSYYDCLLLSQALLQNAKSCLGLGVIGSLAVYFAEHG